MNLIIKNGRLIDPASNTDKITDIKITDGIIENISENILPEEIYEIIDAKGCTIFPGLTDIHCHFRDPGWPEKETIETGAAAALAGGVTTVVTMANTNPVTDNTDTLKYILNKGKNVDITLLQNSAMTIGLKGKELVDLEAMLKNGACGFSDDGIPIEDPSVMISALKEIQKYDAVLSLHEELPSLRLSAGVNYGAVAKALGVLGAPIVSESALIERDIALQSIYGGRLHFQHVSTARSYELIKEAKKNGATITAEVTPQHFILTDDILLSKGADAKINPPIRGEEDRLALLQGVLDGTFDCIVTDHAPHTAVEKASGIEKAPSGMTGLETSLSLSFEALVKSGKISRLKLAEIMCINGAKLYNVEKKIAVNKSADLIIFDENKEYTMDYFYSRSTNTPFKGRKMTGKVLYTICNNNIHTF